MNKDILLANFGSALGHTFVELLNLQRDDGTVSSIHNVHDPGSMPETFSLTNHFIAALTACGYTTGPHLEKAIDWFWRL